MLRSTGAAPSLAKRMTTVSPGFTGRGISERTRGSSLPGADPTIGHVSDAPRMSEGPATNRVVDALLAAGRIDALGKAAAILEYPLPRERDDATCQLAARAIDALLVRVAKGRGAVDVAIGEGLEAMAPRKMQLGFATIGDYAREKLGIAASTAQKMARAARELQKRPLLRKAVWAGEVSMRAAEAVFPVAIGEAEARWVELARTATVRELQAAVKELRGPDCGSETPAPDQQDEKWGPILARVAPEQMPGIEEAMFVARRVVDAAAPRWKLLDSLCAEFLGVHDTPDFVATSPDELVAARREESNALWEWLENESAQWAFLDQPVPIAAPVIDGDVASDARGLRAELRRLATLRDRWDEVFGHVALLFRSIDAARRLGFGSFEHYCSERLGLAVRSAEQRIALERKLYELPALKRAMGERRVSYEQARLIARYAETETVDAWIERAETMPCIDLRRELQGLEQAQLCARGEFQVWAPRPVAGLFAMACGAARKAEGRWISDGECLVRIAAHFLDVWKPVVEGRVTESTKILDRDDGLCRVPGCSLAADHAHHIKFKSHGGSDAAWNRVSLCAAHHLNGVHAGWIKVSGTAPDGLRWELGVGGPRLEL